MNRFQVARWLCIYCNKNCTEARGGEQYKKIFTKSLSTKLLKRCEDRLSIVVWLVKRGIIT